MTESICTAPSRRTVAVTSARRAGRAGTRCSPCAATATRRAAGTDSRAADAPPAHVRQAYARAAELAAEMLRQQPEDISALVSLASFRIHLGQDAAARELLQRAMNLGTDNAEEMYFIAESAERLGDRELALEWIGRALRAGYPLQVIEDYPDLAELREDPRFRDAVERAVGPTANRVADGDER